MLEVTPENVKDIVEQDCHILFYFTATWCGPCQKIKPMIQKLSDGLTTDSLRIYMVDIDENDELCEKCGITSVPTFMLFKNKEEVGQCGGANIEKVADLIKPYC